jgi:protein-tyrosine phosphatase
VDLHCHVVPGIDDGVRTIDEAVDLARGLAAVGFERIVATPHVKTASWENTKETIAPPFDALVAALGGSGPRMEFAAEHWCDDVYWDLLVKGHALRYPGGKSLLLEFDRMEVPLKIEERFFEMRARHSCRPILAHPERYQCAWGSSFERLERLSDAGALFLVDLTSLAGRHGRKARGAAERLLEEGLVYAVCSDAHRPKDVDAVNEGIRVLHRTVGDEDAERLLGDRTQRIREGRFDDV